jgi:hypothetical protein
MPYTSSPGRNRVTPGSMSSTTPLTSQPRMNGGSPSIGKRPDRTTASTGFTPTARTRTSTSVGNGTGRFTSANSSTSGPPKVRWRIACIVADIFTPPFPTADGGLGRRLGGR